MRTSFAAGASLVVLCALVGVVVGRSQSQPQPTDQSPPGPSLSASVVSATPSSSIAPVVPLQTTASGAGPTTVGAIRRQVLRFEGVYFSLLATDTTATKMAELMPSGHPIISHECNCYVAVPDEHTQIGRVRKATASSVVVLPPETRDFRFSFMSNVRAEVELVVRQQTTIYPDTSRQKITTNMPLSCTVGLVHSQTDWLVDSVTC